MGSAAMADQPVAEGGLAGDASPLLRRKGKAEGQAAPVDSDDDDDVILKQRSRGKRVRAAPRAETHEAQPNAQDSDATGAMKGGTEEEGASERGAGKDVGKGRGRKVPGAETLDKKKGKGSTEVLDTPRDSAETSRDDSDGYAPSRDADTDSAGRKQPWKADATGEAAEAPKTPPSTIEGGSEGDGPASPGPARAPATSSKPGTKGGAPEDPCLGCFNLCIWFERDRARVLGMPKRHASLRSVTVNEALERQQQLSAKQRQLDPGTKKAHPLGFPLQTVLASKPAGDKILAVEFGASSSATAKLIPLGDIYGLRRWAGKPDPTVSSPASPPSPTLSVLPGACS